MGNVIKKILEKLIQIRKSFILGPFGLDWTYCYWNWKLKTENWKLKIENYCSKIIFKCVNSVMGPWTVHEQYMNSAWTVHKIVFFVPCIVKSCDFTVHAQEKKKKAWKRRTKNATFSVIQMGTLRLMMCFITDLMV